jgi:hypothetical protein
VSAVEEGRARHEKKVEETGECGRRRSEMSLVTEFRVLLCVWGKRKRRETREDYRDRVPFVV